MTQTMAFTLSQEVHDWLREKKKESVSMSNFVNRLLEAAMIAEMEKE